jgi:UMF1 family MFS transporter
MAEKKIKSSNTKGLISWAMYDWANSSFSAIIQTFVFAAYFTEQVASNDTQGSILWGFINSAAAIVIAIGGPILGSIADYTGRRKSWLGFFTLLCIVSTALMWFVIPGRIALSFILAVLGIVGAEFSYIFYDAMLPDLAGPKKVGRWSGWGWALGYAGGMLSLIISLVVFVQPPTPWISLQTGVRATFVFCAFWYFIFSLPIFLITPDLSVKQMNAVESIKAGLNKLKETFKQRKNYKNIIRFLLARMFIIDGLTTLFSFGGVYAATVYGMNQAQILLFGITLHVSAGIGAFVFAWVDDWIGSKKLMLLSLICMIIPSSILLFVNNSNYFWGIGMFLGIFVGPVQAASRSWMAKNSPKDLQNQMFGFVALSGKATAFFGPLMTSFIIYFTNNQRFGMCVIPLFLLFGGILLFTVKDEARI